MARYLGKVIIFPDMTHKIHMFVSNDFMNRDAKTFGPPDPL